MEDKEKIKEAIKLIKDGIPKSVVAKMLKVNISDLKNITRKSE